jgi:hypothetical protein
LERSAKPRPLSSAEERQGVREIAVVVWTHGLGLEQELNLGSEVRDPSRAPRDLLETSANARVASVDPIVMLGGVEY